jgi:hypothetical protein
MTKIWCTICHKTDFNVFPPTRQDVLDHIATAHNLTTEINTIRSRNLWCKSQDVLWEKRRTQLRRQLHVFRRQSYESGERDKSPNDDIFDDLLSRMKQHMEVYNDDAPTGEIAASGPRFAINAGGNGYKTIGQRSSQIATVVERSTSAEEFEQMVIPPSAQGVGWHHMADSGYEPVDAGEKSWIHRFRSGSLTIEQTNANERQSTDEEDAAQALVAMSGSQMSENVGSQHQYGQFSEL